MPEVQKVTLLSSQKKRAKKKKIRGGGGFTNAISTLFLLSDRRLLVGCFVYVIVCLLLVVGRFLFLVGCWFLVVVPSVVSSFHHSLPLPQPLPPHHPLSLVDPVFRRGQWWNIVDKIPK